MICPSVYLLVFIRNLLVHLAKKILLMQPLTFGGITPRLRIREIGSGLLIWSRFGKVWQLSLAILAQECAANLGKPMHALTTFSLLAFLALAMKHANAAESMTTIANSCDSAAASASVKWGVPEQVMLAIARVETGRDQNGKVIPWPWTINLAGKGLWFDSKEQSVAFAENTKAQGNMNFDVGCFQINMSWHPGAFSTLEDAFDPTSNADYAAEFLTKLFNKTGSWRAAAAAYHSSTPEYAEAYVAKLEPILRTLLTDPTFISEVVNYIAPTKNGFPLLQRGESSGNGSLMPLLQMNGSLIEGTP